MISFKAFNRSAPLYYVTDNLVSIIQDNEIKGRLLESNPVQPTEYHQPVVLLLRDFNHAKAYGNYKFGYYHYILEINQAKISSDYKLHDIYRKFISYYIKYYSTVGIAALTDQNPELDFDKVIYGNVKDPFKYITKLFFTGSESIILNNDVIVSALKRYKKVKIAKIL